MAYFDVDDPNLNRLIAWGEARADVRAMLLTSTRAIPGGRVDAFSDYDVILALEAVRPYAQSRGWLSAFGEVLVMYQDPLLEEFGLEKSGNVVQFAGGLKIDFTLWPVAMLSAIAALPELPAELDAGYQVLLDKDGLADRLRPPSYRGYIPAPPAERDYLRLVEEFFLAAIYVARYIRRGDRVAAHFLIENELRHEHLRPLLEWHMESERGWSVKTGNLGRGIQRWLRPDLLEALARTYTGLGEAESWSALEEVTALMRVAARETAERLGFVYPEEMDRQVSAYIQSIRAAQAGK